MESKKETKGIAFDWNEMRYDANAILCLNGLLSNPSYTNTPAEVLAQKAVDHARALESKLAVKPESIE